MLQCCKQAPIDVIGDAERPAPAAIYRQPQRVGGNPVLPSGHDAEGADGGVAEVVRGAV